jgi:hypothetical protein
MDGSCTNYRASACGSKRGVGLQYQVGNAREFCSWRWQIDQFIFTPHNVRGDGNCLFYCCQLAGIEQTVAEMRINVSKFMTDHKKLLIRAIARQSFSSEAFILEKNVSAQMVQEVIDEVSTPGAHVGLIGAVFVSLAYHIDMYILSPYSGSTRSSVDLFKFFSITPSMYRYRAKWRTLFLWFHNADEPLSKTRIPNHYLQLKPLMSDKQITLKFAPFWKKSICGKQNLNSYCMSLNTLESDVSLTLIQRLCAIQEGQEGSRWFVDLCLFKRNF